jgi:polyhydroxyalkanoate synthesis regulator phasin
LYVPNLATVVDEATGNITTLQGTVADILDNYVTKGDLGGDGSFDFVNNSDFKAHVSAINGTLQTIQTGLDSTVKTNSEGHVTTLNVN